MATIRLTDEQFRGTSGASSAFRDHKVKRALADDVDMRRPVEMRQPAAATVFFICSMLLLLWFGVLVVMSPSGIPLIGLGAVGVFLALAARTLFLKVVANDSGLLVRNTLRTRRFTWNEVEDFALGQQLTRGADVVNVLLRNGHVVPLDVTSISWPFVRGGTAKREQTMEALRQWLPSQNASS